MKTRLWITVGDDRVRDPHLTEDPFPPSPPIGNDLYRALGSFRCVLIPLDPETADNPADSQEPETREGL